MNVAWMLGCTLALLAAGDASAQQRYQIDARHSQPMFAVGHLGFSTQYGRFNRLSGVIELDREARRGSIDVTIEAASIDMGDTEWSRLMQGEDFFAVEANPYLIFRSETILFDGDTPVAAEGRLSLLGVVTPVRLEIERFRCGLDVSARRQKCGADASASLLRSAHGMKKYIPFVADEVRLILPVEAYLVDTGAASSAR